MPFPPGLLELRALLGAIAVASVSASTMHGQVPETQRPGVAVFDFSNVALIDHATYDPLKGGLADFLTRDLTRSWHVRTVERKNLDKVLAELNLPPDKMDVATVAKVGHIVGARYVVVGAFLIDDQRRARFDARAVDVQTTQVVRTVSVRGSSKKIMELVEQLGDTLVKALDLPALAAAEPSDRPQRYSAVFRDRADVVLQLLSVAKYAKGSTEARAEAYRKFLAMTEPDYMPEDREEARRWLGEHAPK